MTFRVSSFSTQYLGLPSFSRSKQISLSSSSQTSQQWSRGRASFLFQKEADSRSFTRVYVTPNHQQEDNNKKDGNSWVQYENKSNIRDQVLTCISANGEIKVTATTFRNVVNDLMMQHTLTAVTADALGRAVGCALLLSNGMKNEQTFQLTVNGDGPIRGVLAISNGLGNVRGYVGTPQLGQMPLTEAVGRGTIQVVKNHPDWPRPYNGITAIRDGDIDRDVGIYLAESEQRSCALAAATTIHGILCTSAGGYIVEQLPGCTEETVRVVEQNLANFVLEDGTDQLPTGILSKGGTPLDICQKLLGGLDMQPLEQIEPRVICECNDDRLLRAVRLLPKEEVDDIMKTVGKIEARCQFCGKVYRWGPEELEKRLALFKSRPQPEFE